MGFAKMLPPEYRDIFKYAHWACVGKLSREIYGKPVTELTPDQVAAIAAACIAMDKVHPAFKYTLTEEKQREIKEKALEVVKKYIPEEKLREIGLAA